MKYQIGLWNDKNKLEDNIRSKPMPFLYAFLQKLAVVEKLSKTCNRTDGTRCQLCNQDIDNTKFIIMVGKNTFIWSGAYKHYLSKHNVMPDKNFMGMVITLYKSKVGKNRQ